MRKSQTTAKLNFDFPKSLFWKSKGISVKYNLPSLADKSSYKNLTDAVEFAYQNNLNVLIEDFTGVG